MSILTFAVFFNEETTVDSLIDEKASIDEFGIDIQLLEEIKISYNSYELTPTDSTKLKFIFKDNHLLDEFHSSMIKNNCIWFKLIDNKSFENDMVLMIDPSTKENWCYSFMNPDFAYSTELSDGDIEFVMAIEEKYSSIAKQISPSKGNITLQNKKKEENYTTYIYFLDYPNVAITEVYSEISYDDIGSSGSYYSDNDFSEGYLNIKVYDDEYQVKKLLIIIRGFEIINEEEVQFQNIYRFYKPDL